MFESFKDETPLVFSILGCRPSLPSIIIAERLPTSRPKAKQPIIMPAPAPARSYWVLVLALYYITTLDIDIDIDIDIFFGAPNGVIFVELSNGGRAGASPAIVPRVAISFSAVVSPVMSPAHTDRCCTEYVR